MTEAAASDWATQVKSKVSYLYFSTICQLAVMKAEKRSFPPTTLQGHSWSPVSGRSPNVRFMATSP